MLNTSTEVALRDWRYGQTQAERLSAAILHIEGFNAVDPQCPLGGPDGGKDIICSKLNDKYIARCYFPTTHKKFADIQKKFNSDFAKTKKYNVSGFVFFVNQPLTPTERENLVSIVGESKLELFHLERMKSILDSPKGYGIRLEYLRILMKEEEQYAFWSALNIEANNRFEDMSEKLELVLMRTNAIHQNLLSNNSSLASASIFTSSFPTEQISIPLLLWLHKLATDGESIRMPYAGVLRGVQVWIGKTDSSLETAQYIPPQPSDVPRLLEELLLDWRTEYKYMTSKTYEERLTAIANFHHKLLSIHPFLDANGRVARCILEQQAIELLGRRVSRDFVSIPNEYYEYLTKADNGDIKPLTNLLKASLE